MLVGRAVKVCNSFPDTLPLLVRSGGEFRPDGQLRWVYFILCTVVSWLSGRYIEDVFTLPLYASCLVRELAFDTVSWCLSYVRGMNLPFPLTSSARFLSARPTPRGRPQVL